MNSCVSLVSDTSHFHTKFSSLFGVDVSREGYAVVMSGVDSSDIAGAFILNYCDNGFNANAALGNTLRDLALNFA